MTTAEASIILGVKSRSVVQNIKRGLIAATFHGRDYDIDPVEVARYAAARHKKQQPIQAVCQTCGKPYTRPANLIGRYCSKRCINNSPHDIPTRFWMKVNRSTPDVCWLWVAGCNAGGYGSFHVKGRSSICASRMAYELTYGEIPPGMQVCHHCDNRPCCNPNHLFLGTPADNMRDRDVKGRQARGPRTKQSSRLL